MKKLGLGYENYKEFIDHDMYYVDKTLFIRDLLMEGGKVNLFTRPRRFGKTLSLSMLCTFFEAEKDLKGNPIDNHRYFEGKKISLCDSSILSKMGRYPVINISLKSARQPSFYASFVQIRDEIIREYDRHAYIAGTAGIDEKDKEYFREIRYSNLMWRGKQKEYCNKEVEKDALEKEIIRFATALKNLSAILEKYHGEKTIILIDEYDVPLENAFYEGFYKEMIDFLRSMFESVLKTNDSLELAVITGCLRISKESIFTGLNNLSIYSILTPNYGEYFGFTDDEVLSLLNAYNLSDKYEEIKEWYGGHLFGDSNVYNPWSTILYVSDHIGINRDYFPISYWANTSSNSIVKDLVERADDETKRNIEKLIDGKSIEKPIHEDITYGEVYRSQDNLWNFMFFTGYLKTISQRFEGKQLYCMLEIPNKETYHIYSEKIINWFQDEIVQKADRSSLFNALKVGDAETLEEEINKLLRISISYMDNYENFYHGFMVGILLGGPGYSIKSNRESGDGRSDILIKPMNQNMWLTDRQMKLGRRSDILIKPTDPFERAFVIELKVVKLKEKNKTISMELMDAAADAALRQIEEKHYTDALKEEGYPEIGRYGISFFGKRCRVHYTEGAGPLSTGLWKILQ